MVLCQHFMLTLVEPRQILVQYFFKRRDEDDFILVLGEARKYFEVDEYEPLKTCIIDQIPDDDINRHLEQLILDDDDDDDMKLETRLVREALDEVELL